MTSMRWFRLYSEIRTDFKLSDFTPTQKWAFIVLLCLANDSPKRGIILGAKDDKLAKACEMPLNDWLYLKDRFAAEGLIELSDANEITVCNWDKRQYSSDTSTERVRQHRAKQKKQLVKTDVVTETEVKRFNGVTKTPSDPDPDPDPDSYSLRASEQKIDEPERTNLEQINFSDLKSEKFITQYSADSSRPNFKHPTQLMENRFKRAVKLEEWEVAIDKPDPQFIDWIVAHNKQGNSALPPKVMASRMLYNSRDRGNNLAELMWTEYQESKHHKESSTKAAQSYTLSESELDTIREQEKQRRQNVQPRR